MQKSIIKLTQFVTTDRGMDKNAVLIGTESIIRCEEFILKPTYAPSTKCTKIESRGAMVTTTYVKETIEQIYKLINE